VQPRGLRQRAALQSITAELMHQLRREPEVAHDRDSALDQVPDHVFATGHPLDLHGGRAGLHQRAGGIRRRVFAAARGEKRRVGHDDDLGRAAPDGRGVRDHHLHRRVDRARETVRDHATLSPARTASVALPAAIRAISAS